MQGQLTATFASPEEAAARRDKLQENTNLLKTFFERDRQQPASSALATALLSGTFEQRGPLVTGRWPLTKSMFLKALEGR